MWKSDNPLVRFVRFVVGLGIVAVILLTALTIIFSFPEKSTATNATAKVQSCVDTGPITRRGFGHNWDCKIAVRDDKTGERWTDQVDMNVFSPEDVGKEKPVAWGYAGGRIVKSDNRHYSTPEGSSTGTHLVVMFATGAVAIVAALWFLSRAIIWSFSQQGQRKFWEKIHGSSEEKAAKKEKDDEFWAEMRRNRELRKQAKERRKNRS
ncbi:hypothetical protein EIL87_14125 [Saccharopolyspora rhizosphaerae]|uniref:Uncharacterized protein n=1 Tax=Saccharopolyspora rhizosphaerae TaxID=2492662 RepID=A0A3R8NYV4_9PSEU|nr:DUF6346 domain-containing protein [Saccharopolyspora rhizosphaerae]RRO16185.1 hypothetical protein EIL87_14125 [Saccharopolyspora rhizosphaerae]